MQNTAKRRRLKISLIIVVVLVAAMMIAAVVYVQDYYHALPGAQAIAQTMRDDKGDLYFDGGTQRGFILYPGGKVDEQAYAELAQLLHAQGDTVVIARMPLRLAIMDTGRAKEIIAANPGITSWYIIGHSLGGTAASMVLADNPGLFDGIVLLGSYAYKDLTGYDGVVLEMHGAEDHVLDMQKAAEAESLLPQQAISYVIEGGNHAGFGLYGPQAGDGTATITPEEQQRITAAQIMEAVGP